MAAFLVAVAALLALPLQAHADVLVSNIGQTLSSSTQLALNEMAQGFETGDNTGNYTLESIDINFASLPVSGDGIKLTVRLWSATSSGLPDSSLARLSNPSDLSTQSGEYIKTFTAPANTVLEAETIYFVHMSYVGGSLIEIDRTQATGEDANPASGWSINNNRLFRSRASNNSWNTSTHIGSIRVNGTVIEGTTPTLSDDATLSGLTVNDGTSDLTLTPGFGSGTYVYAANVGNAVTTVTLTATVNDANASVTGVTLGGTVIADTDFTNGITVPSLVEGDNVIVVTVTAEDATTQAYTVTVTRRMSEMDPENWTVW